MLGIEQGTIDTKMNEKGMDFMELFVFTDINTDINIDINRL